ncbi:MAG: alpha-glucan family phosphorylase [Phycisphaerae bacterium]|nr:alpha-glucan family phosphorylase [Phycisphaerae bacterium]
MRPLRTFTVEPNLPDALAPLKQLAYNLRWAWHGDALDLFRRLDPQAWDDCHHNPVAILGRVDQNRLQALSVDEGFLAHLRRVRDEMNAYLQGRGWWRKTHPRDDTPVVAYFCAEFGLTECLPIYSGGLGVLAGDHLKSASDLDLPLVAVGLLYQQGYFRQRLNADGWQLELFPRNDFHNMPIRPVTGPDGQNVVISIPLADRTVKAQVWRVDVGRIVLYLLDTNITENSLEDRHITAQLYGGDQDMRIRQEIVLGIGGVSLLRALEIPVKAYHMNEGHSAFLSLERIRRLMVEKGASFNEAREAVAASNIFTTHTPVPAGNDAFEPWLIEKYFAGYWDQLGLSMDEFMNLGRAEPPGRDEPMNLTILALRMSAFHNGVSRLHGQVSRKLWNSVWPALPQPEIPIDGLVNGIHTLSWISHDMAELYDRYLGPDWHEKPPHAEAWEATRHIPDAELWRTHERRRERLTAFARRRQRDILAKRGAGAAEMEAAEEILDPEALTIGFARRFATYKRANLIFSDLNRLERIVNRSGQKVQIIFAGKAHPRDNPGKDLIRQIVHISRTEPFRRSLVFLEDYDINVARYLVQGVDVWLNTPLRPMEASGTSGMKVAANAGLNLSVLDGWWAEGYDPEVGWAIGSGETYDDLDYQNQVESQALYDLLEKEIIPLFYDRGSDNLPRGWIEKMKASIRRLAPVFNTYRMVRQYAESYYAPAAARWDELTAENLAQARELSRWKDGVQDGFHHVQIESVNDDLPTPAERIRQDGSGAKVGKNVRVEAVVNLGGLKAEDVAVELYCGRLDEDGQLTDGHALPMEHVEQQDAHRHRYAVHMPCQLSGMVGYTVRVLPGRQSRFDTRVSSRIRWA